MVSKKETDSFLANKHIAIVGASSSGKGFGNTVIGELIKHGYTLYPVHPATETINGIRAYPALKELPAGVTSLFVALKPAAALEVVKEAIIAGISSIWSSPKAMKPWNYAGKPGPRLFTGSASSCI